MKVKHEINFLILSLLSLFYIWIFPLDKVDGHLL
jgi:hypothetical protein